MPQQTGSHYDFPTVAVTSKCNVLKITTLSSKSTTCLRGKVRCPQFRFLLQAGGGGWSIVSPVHLKTRHAPCQGPLTPPQSQQHSVSLLLSPHPSDHSQEGAVLLRPRVTGRLLDQPGCCPIMRCPTHCICQAHVRRHFYRFYVLAQGLFSLRVK